MTGPTRAPATLAADLAGLSEQASVGPWVALPSKHVSGAYVHQDRPNGRQIRHAVDTATADGRYIVALVNAHRAGHLVTLDAALDWVAEQLADLSIPNPYDVDDDGCRCGAWSASECGCGRYVDWAWKRTWREGYNAALAALRDRATPVPDTAHAGQKEAQ